MWINLLYYNNHEVVFQSNPITKDITSNQLIGYHWLWSSYCNINKCLLFLSLWIHPGFKLDSCCSTIHFLCNVLSTIVCRFDLFLFGHCIVCPSLIYGFWLPFWPLSFWSLYCLSFFDLWLLITVFWYLSTFLYIPVEYLLIDSIT